MRPRAIITWVLLRVLLKALSEPCRYHVLHTEPQNDGKTHTHTQRGRNHRVSSRVKRYDSQLKADMLYVWYGETK